MEPPLHTYLSDLQRNVESLKESGIRGPPLSQRIMDSNLDLLGFCRILELIYQHGLKNMHFFQVVQSIALNRRQSHTMKGYYKDFNLCRFLDMASKNEGILTFNGKARYLLRILLKHRYFGQLFYWVHEHAQEFYSSDAILNKTQDYDKFMEMIKVLDTPKLDFDLNLDNTAFLDQTWLMPNYRRYELVPCKDLGLLIHVIKGRSIVVEVNRDSVAGEDGKVEVGDVIESINGSITLGHSPHNVSSLIKKESQKGRRPIVIGVIKGRLEESKGSIFTPLIHLWEEARLKTSDVIEKWSEYSENKDSSNINELLCVEETKTPHGIRMDYLGSVKVGNVGDMSVLDLAIDKVIATRQKEKVIYPVRLVLGELGVKMYCTKSGDLALSYKYPEVSSCGRGNKTPEYLAFVSGNNLCMQATEFLCHVFLSSDYEKTLEFITGMANGFERTRNTV